MGAYGVLNQALFPHAKPLKDAAGHILTDGAAGKLAQSRHGGLHVGEHCVGGHTAQQGGTGGLHGLQRPARRLGRGIEAL